MIDYIKKITGRDLTKLNKINQDTKNIFSPYYSIIDSFIIGESAMNVGQHFCELKDYDIYTLFDRSKSEMITLNPEIIYHTIKDKKKYIEYLIVEDNKIYLKTDTESINIGQYETITDTINEYIAKKLSIINEYQPISIIDDEGLEEILSGGCYTHYQGKYRIRLIKKFIPLINKKLEIYINTFDSESDSIFITLLKYEKHIIVYHFYKCFMY